MREGGRGPAALATVMPGDSWSDLTEQWVLVSGSREVQDGGPTTLPAVLVLSASACTEAAPGAR